MEKNTYMLSKFFMKSVGTWVSHRSYYYANNRKVVSSVTEFTWEQLDIETFKVYWDNKIQNSKGVLTCHFDNEFIIKRDAGYFTKEPTNSLVILCSDSVLKTETIYNNIKFVETIEFLTSTVRIRKTLATKFNEATQEYNKLFLVGNYIEYKQV